MKKQLSKVLEGFEGLVYIVVAVLLVIIAAITIVNAFKSFNNFSFGGGVTLTLTTTLNDALFVIILMELLQTVTSHLAEGGFQLRPFLIIGIISSVRRILVVGAQLSTAHHLTQTAFNDSLRELAFDAGVVVALTGALYVVQRLRREERREEITQQRRSDPIVHEEIVGHNTDSGSL
ncbi:MAG: phosphate-starvation-inducible PsiE family protein [Acidimicrobiales bacterium]